MGITQSGAGMEWGPVSGAYRSARMIEVLNSSALCICFLCWRERERERESRERDREQTDRDRERM